MTPYAASWTNCAQAARPNGRVLVIESIEPGESANSEMDLRMLAYVLGRERSLDQLTELAHEAGLAPGTVTLVSRDRSIIELWPDQASQTD